MKRPSNRFTESYYESFIGKVSGKLTCIEVIKTEGFATKLKCLCLCGNITYPILTAFNRGKTSSCGCGIGKSTTHGKSRERTYRIWVGLRARCNNKSSKDYPNYGGRGIIVEPSWDNSFIDFLKDNGECPNEYYSIDRIDNDKGYIKGNTRWTSREIQQNNRRNTLKITFAGVTKSLSEWCKYLGVASSSFNTVRYKGKPVEYIRYKLFKNGFKFFDYIGK